MLGLNPEQLLGIGLTLQTASCLSAACGLAFMKRSTELEGDKIIVYRFWWWVGFFLLGIVATFLTAFTFSIVPLSTVAPFAGLTIVFSVMLAQTGLITEKEQLQRYDLGGLILVVGGVLMTCLFGPRDELGNDSTVEAFARPGRYGVNPFNLVHVEMHPFNLDTVQGDHGASGNVNVSDIPDLPESPDPETSQNELENVIGTLTDPRFISFVAVGTAFNVAWLVVLCARRLRTPAAVVDDSAPYARPVAVRAPLSPPDLAAPPTPHGSSRGLRSSPQAAP
eukprot:Transcript_298.p1 GENE.Transcript_298~~Transcript_298.p1  ORF type:complete len:308 (-),score=74.51 Transcript_298:601-1440(-)